MLVRQKLPEKLENKKIQTLQPHNNIKTNIKKLHKISSISKKEYTHAEIDTNRQSSRNDRSSNKAVTQHESNLYMKKREQLHIFSNQFTSKDKIKLQSSQVKQFVVNEVKMKNQVLSSGKLVKKQRIDDAMIRKYKNNILCKNTQDNKQQKDGTTKNTKQAIKPQHPTQNPTSTDNPNQTKSPNPTKLPKNKPQTPNQLNNPISINNAQSKLRRMFTQINCDGTSQKPYIDHFGDFGHFGHFGHFDHFDRSGAWSGDRCAENSNQFCFYDGDYRLHLGACEQEGKSREIVGGCLQGCKYIDEKYYGGCQQQNRLQQQYSDIQDYLYREQNQVRQKKTFNNKNNKINRFINTNTNTTKRRTNKFVNKHHEVKKANNSNRINNHINTNTNTNVNAKTNKKKNKAHKKNQITEKQVSNNKKRVFRCQVDEKLRKELADMINLQRQKQKIKYKSDNKQYIALQIPSHWQNLQFPSIHHSKLDPIINSPMKLHTNQLHYKQAQSIINSSQSQQSQQSLQSPHIHMYSIQSQSQHLQHDTDSIPISKSISRELRSSATNGDCVMGHTHTEFLGQCARMEQFQQFQRFGVGGADGGQLGVLGGGSSEWGGNQEQDRDCLFIMRDQYEEQKEVNALRGLKRQHIEYYGIVRQILTHDHNNPHPPNPNPNPNSNHNPVRTPPQSKTPLTSPYPNLLTHEQKHSIKMCVEMSTKLALNQGQLQQQQLQLQQLQLQLQVQRQQQQHSEIICAICQTNIPHNLWNHAMFYTKTMIKQQDKDLPILQQSMLYQSIFPQPDPAPQPARPPAPHNDDQIPLLLTCGHSYHQVCLLQWFRYKSICPLCKTEHEHDRDGSDEEDGDGWDEYSLQYADSAYLESYDGEFISLSYQIQRSQYQYPINIEPADSQQSNINYQPITNTNPNPNHHTTHHNPIPEYGTIRSQNLSVHSLPRAELRSSNQVVYDRLFEGASRERERERERVRERVRVGSGMAVHAGMDRYHRDMLRTWASGCVTEVLSEKMEELSSSWENQWEQLQKRKEQQSSIQLTYKQKQHQQYQQQQQQEHQQIQPEDSLYITTLTRISNHSHQLKQKLKQLQQFSLTPMERQNQVERCGRREVWGQMLGTGEGQQGKQEGKEEQKEEEKDQDRQHIWKFQRIATDGNGWSARFGG